MVLYVVRLSTPPRIKVLEALGAVAGGRVKVISEKEAEVGASEGNRTYKVYVDLEKKQAYSDDNGTVFRNYVGYPIIAFLMVKKVLPFDEEMSKPLADVKWRTLNERYKSYKAVEELMKDSLSKHGISRKRVDEFVRDVLNKIASLELSKILFNDKDRAVGMGDNSAGYTS